MLYLLAPASHLKWTDVFGQSLIDSARSEGIDLGTVDWWKVAERPATVNDVRVALRYGVASEAGIVLDAGNVALVHRPGELRATFAEAAASRRSLEPLFAKVDKWAGEGAEESRRSTDDGVERALQNALIQADAEALEVFTAVEPVPALVEHWARLGGITPNPI